MVRGQSDDKGVVAATDVFVMDGSRMPGPGDGHRGRPGGPGRWDRPVSQG